MLFVLAVSQHFNAAALGVYGLLFFFCQLFSGIAPLGHPMYLAREVAHLRDDETRLGKALTDGLSALVWGTSLSLLVWGGLGAFYGQVSFDLLSLAALAGVLWGVEYLLAGLLIGMERLAINAVWHGASLALVVYFLFFQSFWPLSLPVLFWLRIAATVLGLLGRLWAMRGLGRLVSFSWKLHSYRESAYFWYGGWVFLASRQLDVLVLSFFLSDAALGGYFLALRIFLTFGIIAEILGVALIPFISRAHHGNEERSTIWLFRLVMLGIFVLGVPLGLGFYLGRDWLIAVFNPRLVAEVSPLIASLAWVVPFSLGNHLIGAFFSASRYQGERFYINLGVTLASLAALIPLAASLGVAGAIRVKIASETLLFLIMLVRFMLKLRPDETTGPTSSHGCGAG
jgi:O-antigen/teichoic acid export membrane protein